MTSSHPNASSSALFRFRFLPWLVVALITLAVYWPATRCDFTNFDDPVYVTSNIVVQKGLTWEGIKWAFTSIVVANWHPFTMLSQMLDWQLFGLNPWGHHLTGILLHSLNAALVFAWLRQMTGAMWRSFFVAAFFALHPLRVESVAWIAERKDVLSGCFGLLSLIFYVRYARRASGESSQPDLQPVPSSPRLAVFDYSLAWLFLAIGLMSKPMLVTWPFVMMLLDYWPLGRLKLGSFRRLLLEKLPLFLLAMAACVVTYAVQKRGGAMEGWEHLTFGARWENALISYARYLGKMFLPSDLAVLYPLPGSWPAVKVLLAATLLAGVSLMAWSYRRRHPFLLMGWLWYCGTLVPVIGLVQVGAQALADRYTYLPSLGVLIPVVWGAGELALRRRQLVFPLSLAGAIGMVLCAGLTRHQLEFWHDSETLFRHALQVTTDNYYAHNNLGSALYSKGQVDGAIHEFEEALRLKPGYGECHNNLGAALDDKGQFPEAIQQYEEALNSRPEVASIHHILGVDLVKTGYTDEAIFHLREALRLQPNDAMTHNDLGNALDQKGETDEAISQYQEAIRLDPDCAEAHGNLGAAFGKKGNVDDAIVQLREAIRLKQDDPLVYYNLGMALSQKGQTNEAIVQLQEALRLKPDFAEASNAIGTLEAKNLPAGR